MMRFGDLFSGIGGFTLGLERAGMECAWQVEIDDYCTQVLEKHWPGVERFRDVRKVGKHNLEPVDLICGGFPCQPYSVAGKRRGEADDRNLWPEFLRIIREVRPAWVLGENVPGIVPMYLDTVLSDLEGEGYTCWTFNIPACALDAPHRRSRIFVVAHSQGQRWIDKSTCKKNGNKREQFLSDRWAGEQMGAKIGGRSELFRTNLAYPDGTGLEIGEAHQTQESQTPSTIERRSMEGRGEEIWPTEPRVGRVADGVPHRVDRLRALGNAVVPQVVEFIGRQILAAQEGE